MHRLRVAAAAAVAVVAFAVAVAASAGASSGGLGSALRPVRYVALGDSYSSGVGAGGDIGSSGGCDRSSNAYSALWAAAHAPASYVSVACSGATTADVRASQLSALGAGTTLVSITVGGDDIAFAQVMDTCVVHGTNACGAAVETAEAQARTTLPGALDALFTQIRGRAPMARVVVLDYPRLYDTSVWFCLGLSPTAHRELDEAADVLDDVVQAAAGRHGFAFGEVRSAFAGHEICDSGKWLHSVDWMHLDQSYHPSATGQRDGYLRVLTAAAS